VLYDAEQLLLEDEQVDVLSQARGEGGERSLPVVRAAVEAAIDEASDTRQRGPEQGRDGERRDRDRDRARLPARRPEDLVDCDDARQVQRGQERDQEALRVRRISVSIA
jgi:hypothetical protein